MFTKNTVSDRTWSRARYPVKYDMRDINIKPIACAVAISEKYGLDLLMMYPKSVTNDRFHTFIKRLRAKYPFRRMCMYMDNLSVHRSKATQKVLREQRFEVIFTPAYSPFANCIEECFAVVKQAYKK